MVHPALPFVCVFTVFSVAYSFDFGSCVVEQIFVFGLHLPYLMLCPSPYFCIEVTFGCDAVPWGLICIGVRTWICFVYLILVFSSFCVNCFVSCRLFLVSIVRSIFHSCFSISFCLSSIFFSRARCFSTPFFFTKTSFSNFLIYFSSNTKVLAHLLLQQHHDRQCFFISEQQL